MQEAKEVVFVVLSLHGSWGTDQSSTPQFSQSQVSSTTTQTVSAAEGGTLALSTGETLVIPSSAAAFENKPTDIQQTISDWWKKSVGAPGTIFVSPYDLSNCTRCQTRTQAIKKIIIHSTNNAPKTTFTGLLSFITTTAGTDDEAFFATYYIDADGRIAQLVPDSIQTSHIGGHNSGTIRIQLFDPTSSKKDEWSPTIPPPRTPAYSSAQIAAAKRLIAKLRTKFNLADNSVCPHRHFTNDPLHQDPYHVSSSAWDTFLTSQDLIGCEETPVVVPIPRARRND